MLLFQNASPQFCLPLFASNRKETLTCPNVFPHSRFEWAEVQNPQFN
jgi:hypothetical protein